MNILKKVTSYALVVALLIASVSTTGRKMVKAAYGVGSSVYFGAYFQSWLTGDAEKYAQNLTYDEYNDAKLVDGRWVARFQNYYDDYYMSEPIEWIILKDEGNALMLMSKKALRFKSPATSARENDQWETNNVRAWLNNGFLTFGFNGNERADILNTLVSTHYMSYNDWLSKGKGYICGADEGGSLQTTTDKVFLLDKYEFNSLVNSNDRVAYSTQWSHKKVEPVDWYLRGPATWVYGNLVNIYVTSAGEIDENRRVRMSSGEKGIRPVIRVKKNSKYLSTTKPIIKLQAAGVKPITNTMVTLSGNTFKYTGKNITPSVTVRNGNIKLKKGTDYIVSYSNNKWAGVAKVIVKGCSEFKGTVTKTFRIKYNGKKAAAYAIKHYKKYNKSFKVIKRLIGGTYDCTNFASQCIYAGGLRMISPKKISYNNRKYSKTKKYWYMKKKNNKFGWSSTWSCVTKYSLEKKDRKKGTGLKEYLKKYRHAKVFSKKYKYSSINKLINSSSVGDVLQCTFVSQGKKHETHTMVVSKKWKMSNGRYNIRLCYHSEDKNINLRKKYLELFDKKDKWTLIKMSNAH